MKWVFVLLVLLNIALGGYAYFQEIRPHPDAKIVDFQMNADKIRIVPEPVVPESVRSQASTSRSERTACLEWASFGDLELRRVRNAMSSMGLGDRVSARKEQVTTNWWVYMPPQSSQARMQRKADELVDLGVTDFITITEDGRWQYAISFGAFREEDSARDYLAKLREKGVRSGDIGKREQRVMQTTLVIRAPSAIESTQLVELATQFPGAVMRATGC